MKKFAYVFIFLYGFIVTFGIFNDFNERYFTSMDNTILEYHDWTDKNGLIINLYLQEQGVSFHEVTDKLLEMGKSTSLEIMMSLNHDDIYQRKVQSLYIYSDEFKFEDFFYLEKGTHVDFGHLANDQYISSDSINDEKTDSIKFLSDKYIMGNTYPVLNFMPLHTAGKHNEGEVNFVGISFFFDNSMSMAEMKAMILDAFPFMYEVDIYDLNSPIEEEVEDKPVKLTEFLAPILLLVILLSATSYINTNMKEVSVRKMHGNQSTVIFKRLMRSFILFSILSYTISILFSYFILGGDFTLISLNVVKPIAMNLLMFTGVILIFAILSYLYVRYVASYIELKRSSVNMKMVYGNIIVKTVLLLIVLTPLVHEISTGVEAFRKIYHYGSRTEEHYDYNLFTNQSMMTSLPGENGENINMNQILFEEMILGGKGMYADFSHAHLDWQMIEFYETIGMEIPYPSIIVDYQYLKEYTIRNEDGEVLDLSQITENTVFVPLHLKGEIFQTYTGLDLNGKNTYYVTYEGGFLAPDISWPKILIENPVVYFITKYRSEIQPVYRSAFYSSYDDLSLVLSKYQMESYFDIENYIITHNYYMESYMKSFITAMGYLLLFTIIPMIFLYQGLSFHFNERRKEIALKYSMGSSFLSRYREMILMHLLPYFAILLTVWTTTNDNKALATKLALYFIVIDLLFMSWIVRRFEKKSISLVLKGE